MSNDEIVKVIPLKTPLVTSSGEVKELKFRKPRAGDFRNVGMPAKMGDLLDVAGKMCGLMSVEMDKLEVSDMMEVAAFLGECMGDSLPIGS